MIQSQRWVLRKFLKSNTSTSRDLDALAIVAVEESANANPHDEAIWQTMLTSTWMNIKLLKNYLKLIMSQERLNGLATLCIEKRLLDEIGIDYIIDDFASRNITRNF